MTEDAAQPTQTPKLDHRRLLKLLGGWAAAVLLPGIVTINQPVLVAYVFWGLGFVAALALFIRIARITDTTDLWPWLVASILPWAVNVTVPDIPISIPVFVLAAGLFAGWIFRQASASDRLQHAGVPGTGTVIELIEPKFAGAAVNNGYARRSVRLTVERPDKTKTYQAVLRDLFKVEELPAPGDKIALRIDPEDATRVAAVPVAEPHEPDDEAPMDAEDATEI
ncbi:MAG TPA: hypothetical protein VMZ66_12405 [Aeromicrobium sp.]|nr:hypothetical protein [Aeromicrobium sp.]